MVDVKREDITLQDWTKGISADEFAWGSYFYSEAISSWYNSKGFELWYRVANYSINHRPSGYAQALSPASSTYWFLAFTRDGYIESQHFWNWDSTDTWDLTGWWAIYAIKAGDTLWSGYVNWVTYWDLAIWIREKAIDVVDYKNAYDKNSEILTNTDLSDSTWWTLGTGWTTTTDWAEHTPGNTGTLTTDISSAWLDENSYCRCAVKITNWTAGNLTVQISSTTSVFTAKKDGWYVANLRGKNSTTTLTLTPTSAFDWTIEIVNLHQYDTTNYVFNDRVSLYGSKSTPNRPALIWEWDLYVAYGHYINIISLTDWGLKYKKIIDDNFSVVSITQQAWNIIIWATDGFDSRQYYWNWVDAVASEVIEWKGLIIQWVTGTETISYVLTTSWATSWSVEWYEYRLYAVSWYQRSLIASKLYQNLAWDYLEVDHYNFNKKFDFNDVTNDKSMTIFLDSLYIPGCDGVYKYGSDIPWLRSAWTRPIKYNTDSTHILLTQRGHYLGIWFTADWVNYIWQVDNRLYPSNWYLVTESIYWDKLSTRKALDKIKIWYKNVASTVGNIKVYAIVDDTYFWRFRPSATPTTRPSVWDIYEVANDTTAKVIDVDTTNWVITFVTVEDTGSYPWIANTTLTRVSGSWDASISVGYNFDNMCLIKTIESSSQCYGSDFIFWKDFVDNYLPFWHKLQLVVELNSNDMLLSPEIYEISMVSDITDTVL